MATLLHLSFRVKDPQRSAELYAELLDGTVSDPGPVLRPAGVKSVAFAQGVSVSKVGRKWVKITA